MLKDEVFVIMTKRLLLRHLLEEVAHLRFEHPGAQRISAECEAANESSIRFMEKIGFHLRWRLSRYPGRRGPQADARRGRIPGNLHRFASFKMKYQAYESSI
jgi:RimJ/RimL family protein N-acetyltransferase